MNIPSSSCCLHFVKLHDEVVDGRKTRKSGSSMNRRPFRARIVEHVQCAVELVLNKHDLV